jgi:predicted metal-dependent phosphoesterase TrpH
MLRVQLHLHTRKSKGKRIPTESLIYPKKAIDFAKKAEIDALVFTDHNTTLAYKERKSYARKKGILLINGVEIDTLDGHLIGIGVGEGIESCLKRKVRALEAAELIKSWGGEVYIPHPFDFLGKGLGRKLKEVDGVVEVFNPLNIFGSGDELACRLASKLGKAKAVGADAHTYETISYALTLVNSELEEDAIIKAIKNGKTKFENCRYVTWRQLKSLALERVQGSYQEIKQRIREGWEVDEGYMILANNPLLKPLQLAALEVGIRKKESKLLDLLAGSLCYLSLLYSKLKYSRGQLSNLLLSSSL